MPRYGYATLNHSPLHGLPTQWQAHLDAAAKAGFDAIAPDMFWLRALEAEGVTLEQIADGLRERGLACMEISGLAIGDDERTSSELEENLRYARALSAEFVNTRVVVPVDDEVARRLRACAVALRSHAHHEHGGYHVNNVGQLHHRPALLEIGKVQNQSGSADGHPQTQQAYPEPDFFTSVKARGRYMLVGKQAP